MKNFISLIIISLIITSIKTIKLNSNQPAKLNPEDVKSPGSFSNQSDEATKIITPEYAEPKIKAHVEIVGPAIIKKNEEIGTIEDPIDGPSKLVLHSEEIGTVKREQDVMVSLQDNKVIPEIDDNLEEKKYFGI